MTDVHKRFRAALEDTVKEWKNQKSVRGVFVYGSFARGTETLESDLDVCIIWSGEEAPVRLLSTHKEVRIDMVFMTINEIEAVFEGDVDDVIRTSEVINRLRTSQIEYDPDGMLKKWQKRAMEYKWSSITIDAMKKTALDALLRARKYADQNDQPSAIHEMREGLFQFGRAIVMSNNIFTMLRPAEVLTEVRMLNPMTYQLFLRTYKLRGLDEPGLLVILREIRKWLERVEKQLEQIENSAVSTQATRLLAQAQRQYHGSLNLTYRGDFELATLEMREATTMLGKVMVLMKGGEVSGEAGFITMLRETETEFFSQALVEHGAYDIQPSEINRIINEAQFLVHRI